MYVPIPIFIYLYLSKNVCIYIYTYTLLSIYLFVSIYAWPWSIIIAITLCQLWNRSYSARLPQFELDKIKKVQVYEASSNVNLTTSKRSYSARLPQFATLTTSKTKQFCKNPMKNGKLSAGLTASCHCVFAISPLHLSKVLRLPRKSDVRSHEVLHLHVTQIHAKSS